MINEVHERQFQRLKCDLHQQLVESLDLTDPNQQKVRRQVQALAEQLCRSRGSVLGGQDRERLQDELLAEVFGLGPLEPLMKDPDITDILVNDPSTVYVEKFGRLQRTDVAFADDDHLMRIIQRVVGRLGRRIDEVSPLVDARLPDGSRVNAIIPPLALDGPAMSIRRFGAQPLRMENLLENGSLPEVASTFLSAVVEGRVGMIVSGGTGAGKTTLLNSLSASIPHEERIVTIEDSAELILQHPHRVRLETRPANTEGRGEFSQRELVRNSLRMRPDRIIVGEVRGPEVWDMLQAMNTGHEGSLTTIHANSSRDALARLEMMVAMTGFDLPIDVVRQYIASGIRVVAHVARLKGGVRRLMQISEIVGASDNGFVLEDIFAFEQTGLGEDGRAIGKFRSTGYQPTFLDRLSANGIDVEREMFVDAWLS